MCGLVGIAGEMFTRDEGIMKSLLLFDYFRGTDSTGIAALRNNGNDYALVKMATHPIDLFDSKKFGTLLNGNNSQVFLGHNRAATLGKVNGLNAHPFHYGKIIGAHNGTLDQASWRRLEEAAGVKTDVDSAAIFACIDKIGLADTIALMETGDTSKTGAWALTFIDIEKGTMNFIRNKHRPLWYAWSKDFRRMLWASEYPMIDAAVSLCKTDYDLYEKENEATFFQFAEDTHYEIDLKELRRANKSAPLKPKVKKLEGREPEKKDYTSSYSNVMGYGAGTNMGNTGTRWRDKTGGSSTTTSPSNQSSTGNVTTTVINVEGSEMYPYGGYLDDTDFRGMAGRGCAWCGDDLIYGDRGVTIIERNDAILCPKCSEPNSEGAVRIYADPVKLEMHKDKGWLTNRCA